MNCPSMSKSAIDTYATFSTLIAVLLGALLTYFSTWFFERRKLRDKQRADAWGLFFTVQNMTNDILQLNMLVRQSVKSAESHGLVGDNWTKISDIGGFSKNEKHIATEQLVVLALTQNPEIMMGVLEIQSSHQIYIQLVSRLTALKEDLLKLQLPSAANGPVIGFKINIDQYPKVAPYIVRLKDIGDALVSELPKVALKAKDVAQKLGPHLKQFYKIERFGTISFSERAQRDLP